VRWLILILLILLGALHYRLWVVPEGGFAEVAALHKANQQLREEVERKQAANSQLAAEVIDLKQGKDAVEERARKELGMIRDGEVFYQFVSPEKPK
jgi:cell division protein FtsB